MELLCSHLQVSYPPQHASWSLDDLPRTVACTLRQGSTVMSMDFHPSHHTLLAGKFHATHHRIVPGMDMDWEWCLEHIVLFHSNLLSDLNIMFMNFEQLAVVMEKLLCGKLGCERGWCPSHSKYGKWLLVLWHFRCKSQHLLYKHYESITIPCLINNIKYVFCL